MREIDATVVLTVGTDCNIGKMTTQLQLLGALRERGIRTSFAATGQTGILIEGWGIGVDAVIADFIAGAAEQLVLECAKDADLVLVEGQGSIIHPSYSGVTYGLLHGSCRTRRSCARSRPQGDPQLRVGEDPAARRVHPAERGRRGAAASRAPVIAVALNTFDLDDDAGAAAIERTAKETGLPTTDPVRYDPAPIVDGDRGIPSRTAAALPILRATHRQVAGRPGATTTTRPRISSAPA